MVETDTTSCCALNHVVGVTIGTKAWEIAAAVANSRLEEGPTTFLITLSAREAKDKKLKGEIKKAGFTYLTKILSRHVDGGSVPIYIKRMKRLRIER